MRRLVFRNATIISMDPDVGDLPSGDILVEGATISAVGRDLAVADAQELDASSMIAIPGFVDTHRHTWQCILRNTAVDWSLGQYFAGVRLVMGAHYTPEDVYIANYCGAMEAIDAGITTLYDWSHCNNTLDHAISCVRGLNDSGIRAIYGYGNGNDAWIPISAVETDFSLLDDLRASFFSSRDQLVTLAFAARGPQYSTLDVSERDFREAHDRGLQITVHAGSGHWGKSRPVARLKERGLLYEGTVYVHCCSLARDEMQMIADSGGHVSLSPEVELNMGQGQPATLRSLEVGIKPSFSIDVTTSIGGDMFGAMKAAMGAARNEANLVALASDHVRDKPVVTSRNILEYATLQGAKVCGLGNVTGSLRPGKQADIVLIDTNAFNMFPVNYPVGSVVEAAHTGNIDTVLIAGKIMKRHGKLIGADIRAARKKMDAARDALFERAGVPSDGSWLPVPHIGGACLDHHATD